MAVNHGQHSSAAQAVIPGMRAPGRGALSTCCIARRVGLADAPAPSPPGRDRGSDRAAGRDLGSDGIRVNFVTKPGPSGMKIARRAD